MDDIKQLQTKFVESMSVKTIDFLNESIKNVVLIEDFDKHLTFALINIQLANEFALKCTLANNYGIRSILDISNNISDDEILKKYELNTLKIKGYDQLKNFGASKNHTWSFNDENYKIAMDRFQLFRNRIIHSIYNFSNESPLELKKEIINYFLIVINGIFLSLKTLQNDITHLIEILDTNHLISNDSEYLECVEKYIGSTGLTCVHCDKRSVTENYFCLSCFEDFSNEIVYGLEDCPLCQKSEVVIYDNLNNYGSGELLGYCMNCENKILLN